MTAAYAIGGTATVTLTVDPYDAATTATAELYSPAGVDLGPITLDDADGTWGGTVDPALLTAPGNYSVKWIVEGKGASVSWDTITVLPDPAPATASAYDPTLTQVADYIPGRTLTYLTPGVEEYLGTFTADTTPSDEQVGRLIRSAVNTVTSRIGVVQDVLADRARDVVACLTAAYVELAFPVRAADLNTYDKLSALAEAKLAALAESNLALGATPTGLATALLPVWSYPEPVAWGDQLIP